MEKKSNNELGILQLSPHELRKYKGLENLTNDEAKNIAASLKEFSLLTYQMFKLKNKQSEVY